MTTDELDDGVVLEQAKRLIEACMANAPLHSLISQLTGIMDFLRVHFPAEEHLMRRLRYSGLVDHKREHSELWDHLVSRLAQLRLGDSSVTVRHIHDLAERLISHVVNVDAGLLAFLAERGIGL